MYFLILLNHQADLIKYFFFKIENNRSAYNFNKLMFKCLVKVFTSPTNRVFV